ncbi:helix-turn-helix transcriptional regulator [Parapedobacter koreensis]|uniref:AraC-type DNA-binding protein n=1 Tax=Parapedobacter koreensis TaxID=332977 RepID=A0A1H7F5T6_9SPHI|nr:AraC family transcriptional regulator [Parapedobacter koreensis]SEK18535.1 AraC-type DNA-binding protein [Parapedobacter koreensis]
MKLTSRITSIPGWIYDLEVGDDYQPDSVLEEGVNTIDHPAIRYMEAHYLTTSGLIIANCRMSFSEDTEDLFRIEGSNIMLNFGLSGSIAFEVDKLIPLHPAVLTNHAISYTPYFHGRFLMPAEQQIHYVCIILSESFYFNLISKESTLHKDFVHKMLKKEHTYFSPGPLKVTPSVKCVLSEIVAANKQGRLPRLLLETKIKEILVVQLEQFLYNDQPVLDNPPLQAADVPKLAEAKRILDEQFVKPPLIPTLAKTVMLNEYKLKIGFKAYYQQTVYQYVIHKKMRLALSLLKEGNYTISEVAYQVGYRDISHFSNAFLKYYGYRPKGIMHRHGGE